MKSVLQRKKKPVATTAEKNTVHLSLTTEEKDMLDKMAIDDDRKVGDFLRVMIRREWRKRQDSNGVVAA